jgi:polar amino acid transport system substrate-binding protein
MKKIALILIIGMFLSATNIFGQEIINKIKKEKVLRIGTTGNFFPFTYKRNKTGKLVGIDILIGEALAKELGVEPKFVILPFNDLLPALEKGKIDIVLSGLSITTKRNTKVAFAGTYYNTGKGLLTFDEKLSKGKPVDVNKENITIAAISGSTSELFIKKHYPKANIVNIKDVKEAKKMLVDKKVNGVILDYDVCEKVAFSIKTGKLFYQNISKKTEYEYLAPAVSAKDPLFINLVSNFILRVNAFNMQEEVDKIWLQYLNE